MMYVGVGVHKRVCRAAMVNDEGELVDEFLFTNSKRGVEDFMMKVEAFRDRILVAVESTANLWIRLYDTLEEHGFQVVLSNPSKTRLIAEARVKTDKVNARTLAQLLRADMLPLCFVPSRRQRDRRQFILTIKLLKEVCNMHRMFKEDVIEMVISHSEIFDLPIFPDDTEPKKLRGDPITFGWAPFISGTCVDELGRLLYLIISLSEWPDFRFYVGGRMISMSVDISDYTYENGVLTVGAHKMPRLTIDYHPPHNLLAQLDASTYIELTVGYRGPPLWYSKLIDINDMLRVNPQLYFGGYDAPSSIDGVIHEADSTLAFSGYGVWEHTWLIGNMNTWNNSDEQWFYFNDPDCYGVVVRARDIQTGELLAKTGLFTQLGQAYRFDDFVWEDDGRTLGPKYISVKGRAENGPFIDLATIPEQSEEPFGISAWMFHRIVGNVNGSVFDGYSHGEVRNRISLPPPPPPQPSARYT